MNAPSRDGEIVRLSYADCASAAVHMRWLARWVAPL